MDLSLLEQLENEEALFENFKATGTDRVLVAGNLRSGLSVNIDITGSGPGTKPGGEGGGGDTGACCFDDGSCSIETSPNCVIDGGHYQGNGTTCEGTDCTDGGCATFGACCNGSDCSILCPRDCVTGGGTYQGDGTVCDPNPCALPPCPCAGFTNSHLPGRVFLSLEIHGTIAQTVSSIDCAACGDGASCGGFFNCSGSGYSAIINTITCMETETPGSWNSETDGQHCVSHVCVDEGEIDDGGTYTGTTFCNFDVIAPFLSYSVSGTTVHGHLEDDGPGEPPCSPSDTTIYDLYYVYSNECAP